MMIQGGDPNSKDLTRFSSWGTGGNVGSNGREININSEFSEIRHVPGILSMARGDSPHSASSQFFIMHGVYPSLDGQYSAFGRVVEGMDVIEQIVDVSVVREGQNGAVFPKFAVVLKKVTIVTWPIGG